MLIYINRHDDIYYLSVLDSGFPEFNFDILKINMPKKKLIYRCENCHDCWEGLKFLSKSETELVNENRYEAAFKPGEVILKQGAPASNVLFLANGLAKNYVEGISGRNIIIDILQPTRLILSPGAFLNSRHPYSVAALTHVNTCFINFDIFRQLSRSNMDFAEYLFKDLSRKEMESCQKRVNMARKKMPGRIAEALLMFSDEIYRSDEFEMVLSRQELGEMTNMVKESVVRILKELENSGIIESTASFIKIIDRERLIAISENE